MPLSPAFIEKLKIVFGQIANRFSALVAHDHRQQHEIYFALEGRDLFARCRNRLLRTRQRTQ